MKINSILNTFFNHKGKISRNNYLLGITIGAIYWFLTKTIHFKYYLVILFDTRTSTNTSIGLQNLLEDYSNLHFKSTGLGLLLKLNNVLLIPIIYMIYIITIKRAYTLNLSNVKAHSIAIIICIVSWMLLNLTSFIDYEWTYIIIFATICIGTIGLIIYLYRQKFEIDTDNSPKKCLTLLSIVGLSFILNVAVNYFLGHSSNIGNILRLILMTLALIGFVYVKTYKSNKLFFKRTLLYLSIFIVFQFLNTLQIKYNDSETIRVISNTIAELLENTLLVFFLILPFTLTTLENTLDANTPLFPNKFMNLLFDYKGKVQALEFRAILIFFAICLNAQNISHTIFHIMSKYDMHRYYSFYPARV